MKISLKWLNEYIDIHDYFSRPQDLAALLTAGGLEVEGIEDLAKQFNYVVVGHILEKGQHPNADRLSLCQVATGEGRVHQIVCGAQNHKKDDRVVVALPGAVLPGDLAIKNSKIRGVESGGMLCSEKELGLSKESEGILILSENAKIGQPFAEYMGFDDILFELKVTPNRADCLSHFGLAREIGCLLGQSYTWPLETFTEVPVSTHAEIALDVRETEMCPRYAGRSVKGVKVGPSPTWLKKRLEAVGLGSINNVVDVTNFVMLELGQPLHAFDVRELKGRKVIVDRARAGETFTTLDGTELKLTGEELTIRDNERPVALAGIVGGKNSGIKDDTSEIFIESAYFNPSVVRKAARRFGIETDSSYRFSRGVNPEAIPLAMNRAAQLIQKVAGGDICGDPYDNYPRPIPKRPIEVELSGVSSRLGYTADPKEFVEWMTRLGCDVRELGADESLKYVVTPPLYRGDLSMDVDLVEEFARLHGYQHIPEALPIMDLAPSEHALAYLNERRARGLLAAEGFSQAINYAFISGRFQERILGALERFEWTGLKMPVEPVKLVNPLNEELNVMRISLVPGLVKNMMHNSRHGNSFGRLFEIGFAHGRGAGSYTQEWRLGFAVWGEKFGLWDKPGQNAPPVFALKSVVENMLRSLQIKSWLWTAPKQPKDAPEFVHPGQCASLTVEGKAVGFVGTLHPVLKDELKVREACAVGELNFEKLMAGGSRAPKFQGISVFPSVERDIALAMPKELPAAEVEQEIRKTAGELLRDVTVFDVFEGGNLAAGQRSVAFRLIFQDLNATLADEKVNELRDKVVNAVSQKFSIALR